MPDPASLSTAANGATAFGALDSPRVIVDVHRRRRQIASVIAIVVSSISWVGAFYTSSVKHAGLPWCVTLGLASIVAVIWLFTQKPEIDLRILRIKVRQPVSFVESFASSYLAASFLLFGWISYNMIVPPPPPAVRPQVVDIELTALTDFADNHSILPSNKDLQSLRKRATSDTADSQGQMNPSSQPITAKARAAQTPAPRTKAVPSPEPQPKFIVTVPDDSQLHPAPKVPTPYANERRAPTLAATRDDQPLMEEMDPPELVELVNNDGDQSLNVFQPGGHTSGGTGSKSELASYLKELNRRIKTHWSPPRGETRKSEILFRIERQGGLVSVKILRSSGDPSSDDAAIQSIAHSAPFKQLPSDYPLPFLDVSYTFNYSVDQLSEVTGGQFR